MVLFPRMMITIAGLSLLAILVLAGHALFPAHARLAETIGAAIGITINTMLQIGLWSPANR
jgi:hypothetical protein